MPTNLNKSHYAEGVVLNTLLRATAFTAPTAVYVALYTVAPTDAGGGTEVTGGSYARQAVTSSLANWAGTQGAATTVASTGTSGTTSNNTVITFASMPACTVTGMALMDAVTGGNMLFYSALLANKVINAGDSPTFPAASFTLQIDN